jgi:hypothetical protein
LKEGAAMVKRHAPPVREPGVELLKLLSQEKDILSGPDWTLNLNHLPGIFLKFHDGPRRQFTLLTVICLAQA